MPKMFFDKVFCNFEAWKKLNFGSKTLLEEIKDKLAFFYHEFEPKIYPINSILEKSVYKTRVHNLAQAWSKKLLQIFPQFIMMLADLTPKAEKLVNITGLDLELMLAVLETETISEFKEFVINHVNDVKMYQIMYELENKIKYLTSEKIVRDINYLPYQFELVSEFTYNISFEKNTPNIDINIKTKILKFDINITDDKEIKKEIKNKLKEIV